MILKEKQFNSRPLFYLIIIASGVILAFATYLIGLSLLKDNNFSQSHQEALRQMNEEKLKEIREKKIKFFEVSGEVVKIENGKIVLSSRAFEEAGGNIVLLPAENLKVYKYQTNGSSGDSSTKNVQEVILKPADLKVGDHITFEPENQASLYQLRNEEIKAIRILVNENIIPEVQ